MIPIIIKTDSIAPETQINPVTPITPVTAILDSQSTPAEFVQGQKYQALIELRLLNGNSRVSVANQLLQMRLPENFQPGNKLELIFLSHEPKLQFLVFNETPMDAEKDTASISTTGRFLGTLMQDTFKQASTNTTNTTPTPSVTSPTPILINPPTNSTELPGLLQKAIIESGLFYESHLAQWINGENTLENLHQEPQGKLMLVTADISIARTVAPQKQIATQQDAKGVTPDISTAKTVVSNSLSPEMPVHAQAIPLVQQQLTTLETGHLLWRGEVWQGQSMEWDIYEQSEDKEKENELNHAAQWHTQIRLSMPQLGDITATIALNAQGISIKMNTSRLETASLLRNNQLPLTMDMQLAGLNIQSVEVQQDDRE